MNYPNNFEEKVHFDQVKYILKGYTLSDMGKSLVDELIFTNDNEDLDTKLGKTADMKELLDDGQEFPVSYYIDVRPFLEKIRVEGTFLDISEMFDLKRSVETIASIVSFITKQEEDKCLYLRKMLGEHKHSYPYVRERLNIILTKNGKIKDNASIELRKIRTKLLSKQQSVSRLVGKLLQEVKEAGWTTSDTEASIRDGRLVIPVTSAYKRKIPGIIHDESATGKTSYVEPAQVVEVNNEIRELSYAERREILAILVAFADNIRTYIDDLIFSYNFLAEIDFIRAKARFAQEIKGIRPKIVNKPLVSWQEARHPILDLHFRKEKKTLVPLDIFINDKQRILLISGPNAGGKSVCLKTLGLLQQMLQCGLFVPVAETSKFGLFEKIFIDIGDEQSIDNDLSTYSSHLENMKFFTKNANAYTLLLIDEFGTGTEPLLGGAIAEAVLANLNNKKVLGVITTHYTNLKHFASESEGIVNSAMLYDTHAMTPIYKLEIGIPGSSFAFEIARKIGLNEQILQEAKNKIGEDRVNFDAHLRNVVKDKMIWEKKRFNISQKEKHLECILSKYEAELKDIKKLKKQEVKKAKENATTLLAEANKTIEKTIRTIKENKANKSVTRTIREKFEKDKNRLLQSTEYETNIDRKIAQVKIKEKRKDKNISISDISNISEGMQVKVLKTGVVGEVLSITGKEAIISVGILKMHVKLKNIQLVSNNQAKKIKNTSNREIQKKVFDKRMKFKTDLDVRGARGSDAIQAVTDHIDSALMLGINTIRILHGTGHGILRTMIREYLSKQPDVEKYYDEHVQNGGSGITIIEL